MLSFLLFSLASRFFLGKCGSERRWEWNGREVHIFLLEVIVLDLLDVDNE
jgi:hypothetical protein